MESVGPDGVALILESTPLTKFLYPFDFTVLMNYNLEGNTAVINMTVINEGDTNMPFSFGFHPYFKASKLENVDFDIKCATCSESAKGEQPAAPEKITLTRKEGADNSVRLLTGVQFPMTLTDSGNGHKVTVDADDSFDTLCCGSRMPRALCAWSRGTAGPTASMRKQARSAGAGRGHDR